MNHEPESEKPNSQTTEGSPSFFSADRPIQSFEEDEKGLKRRGFAEALAKAIVGWKGDDSLVLALYGEWGSGKSSLKNLVTRALEREGIENRPNIVEFNPWEFASQDQIFQAFFRTIEQGLGKNNKKSTTKRLIASWRKYEAALKIGFHLSGTLKSILLTPFIIVLLSIILGYIFPIWSYVILSVIVLIIIVIAGLFRFSSKFSENVADFLAAKLQEEDKTIIEIKTDLSKELLNWSRPLLVVMDDIDRLSPKQIQMVFQLVKANADLPRIVYFLLFQRSIVEKSLESETKGKHRDFLEKVIQAGFDIPMVERVRLERVLTGGLDALLSSEGVHQRFTSTRWGNLYFGGLSTYFQTLRDVKRFLATLSFHVGLFRQGATFEVNPIDLIGLEVLRVFENDVYHALKPVKHLLAGLESRLTSSRSNEPAKKAIESIVERAAEERRERVREILKHLFPTIAWALGGSSYGEGFQDVWQRDLRVCASTELFDRYFQFAIPESDISQYEIDKILSNAGNRDALRGELLALKERGLLEMALDRLEAYKETLDLSYVQSFVTAIFDIGDVLPREAPSTFGIGAGMHATRIIYWYVRREPDVNQRESILEAAIRDSTGVYLPAMAVSIEEDKEAKERRPEDRLIQGEESLKTFRKLCVEKIIKAAEESRLGNIEELAYILYRWLEWGDKGKVREWVSSFIGKPEGAKTFLRAFTSKVTVTTIGDHVSRIQLRMSLKSIENFVSLEELERAISLVNFEESESETKNAITVFKKMLARRKKGLPDEPGWMEQDQ